MKRLLSILFVSIFAATALSAVSPPAPPKRIYSEFEIVRGDTVWISDTELPRVRVFTSKSEKRRYDKLVRNVIKVYPIAKQAEKYFTDMEAKLSLIPQKNKRREYVRSVEKELIREFTPVLRKMTFSQGKILIKLIDRQTDKTSYEIVREMRGKLTAAFWQGVARLFDANLKQEYDAHGDDEMIEEIIDLYEAGKL